MSFAILALMAVALVGGVVALVACLGTGRWERRVRQGGRPRARAIPGLRTSCDLRARVIELDELYRRRLETPADAMREKHRCPKCRYDVRLLESPACPECGAPIPFMAAPRGVTAETILADLGDGPLDDAVARRILPRSELADDLYGLLRDCGISPVRSLARVLEVMVRLAGRPLSDRLAVWLLPDSTASRDLYYRHRELGREPMWALRCVLPYSSRCFDTSTQYDPPRTVTV